MARDLDFNLGQEKSFRIWNAWAWVGGVLVWNAYKEIGVKDVFCPLGARRISRIEIILVIL